jgi:hypothetical protein
LIEVPIVLLLERVIVAAAAAGTAINSMLVWDTSGKLHQVKLGSLAVWDRARWEARPRVQRWHARRAKRASE